MPGKLQIENCKLQIENWLRRDYAQFAIFNLQFSIFNSLFQCICVETILDIPASWIWLCLSALAAGIVNSLAGGGTLLTFPTLMVALAPLGTAEAAVVANATSTVALVPGSLAAAWGYRREVTAARRWLVVLSGPSVLGGIVGSLLVTRLDPRYFSALVPWLIFLAAMIFLADTLLARHRSRDIGPRSSTPAAVAGLILFQFGVAVYGGYFGAGIGILMLSSLAMMGVGDIHRMNAVKTLLNGMINGVSVVIFVADRKVDWSCALPMAVSAILGGYLGARAALLVRPKQVRWGVIAIAFGLAIYYFLQ